MAEVNPVERRSSFGSRASLAVAVVALVIPGAVAVVQTARGHHVADPRENNCAECVFVGHRLSPGEVGAPRGVLDFGSSTGWRIDEVAADGLSATGPSGQMVRAGSCPIESLVFPIPGGEMTVTNMCPVDVRPGEEAVVYWQWGKMRWNGAQITQSRRGGTVVEQPVTGMYYYRMGVSTELVPAR